MIDVKIFKNIKKIKIFGLSCFFVCFGKSFENRCVETDHQKTKILNFTLKNVSFIKMKIKK